MSAWMHPEAAPCSQDAYELACRYPLGEARRMLEGEVRLHPQSPRLRFELGKLLLAHPVPLLEEALPLLQGVVKELPTIGEAHLWLARAYGMKMERAGALAAALGLAWNLRKHFELAVRLAPQSPQTRADLFQYCLYAPKIAGGGKERAARQLSRLAVLAAGSPLLLQARAFEALRRSDFARARLYFDEVARLRPHAAGHLALQMGVLLLAAGRYGQALEGLQRAEKSGAALETPAQVLAPDFIRNVAYQKARFELEREISVSLVGGPRMARIRRRPKSDHPRRQEALALLEKICNEGAAAP